MALVGQELSYQYDSNLPLVINQISLEINPGEAVVVAGLNASGKSTLLKILSGVYRPISGQVLLDDTISTRAGRLRPGVGLVMANPERYFFAATVEEEIGFGIQNRGVKPKQVRELVVQALRAVNLGDEFLRRNPFFLSLGEQRKVGIAATLVLQPHYLLLDEPFSNLDINGVHSLSGYLKAFAEAGHTVIVTSHRALEVMWCQRLLVLDQGQLCYDGQLEDWQLKPQLPVLLTEAAYLRFCLAKRGIIIDHLASPQEIANQIILARARGVALD